MLALLLGQVMDWQPLKFHPKEMFEYSIVQEENGEKTEGNYTIRIDGKTLSIKGKWGNSSGKVTIQVDDPEQISTYLFGQMMFNPWLAPLGVTVFAAIPYQIMGAGEYTMEQSDEEGTIRVKKGSSCSYAGQKGRRLVVEENGKVTYDLCIKSDIGLPLYLKTVSEDGSVYEARMIKYSRK